jgi:hypothetical protein
MNRFDNRTVIVTGGARADVKYVFVIATLRGTAAEEFLRDIDGATFAEQQQVMARITGNYRRGNERLAKNHPRNR